jgi:hypothetical protein
VEWGPGPRRGDGQVGEEWVATDGSIDAASGRGSFGYVGVDDRKLRGSGRVPWACSSSTECELYAIGMVLRRVSGRDNVRIVCDNKSAILYVKMVETMRREGRSEEYQHGWVRSVWLAKGAGTGGGSGADGKAGKLS